MNNKPVAIVLGGTFPHSELIRKLKARGYYTILIDYFKNPPAAAVADEHSTASAMDYEQVLQIAKERDAKIVMASCLDQQMNIAIKVAETLGLPHPFSSETAMKVTNKKIMKKIMMENNIPTARYYQVDEQSDLSIIDLTYPVMVKPTDSCGSAGVQKIYGPEELQAAVKKACEFSWTDEAIIEEFKSGMECSAYFYIRDGKAKLVTTSNRISSMDDGIVKCFCAVSPAYVSDQIKARMEEVATAIATAFELNNTPLFYQSIVKGDEVFVIEFSPRLGGGMCYRTMQLNAKFEMLDASIDSYFGKVYEGEPEVEKDIYLIHQVHGKDGIFDHMDGYEESIACGDLDEIYFMKTKGMEISTEKSSSARTAMLLIKGRDSKEYLEKLNRVMDRVEIIDPDGNAFTDKSLILSEKILEDVRDASSSL